MGNGGRIDPIFSFYSLNWGSIQFCFLSKIDICLLSFVSSFMFKVVVFPGIQLWVVEETYKTGK